MTLGHAADYRARRAEIVLEGWPGRRGPPLSLARSRSHPRARIAGKQWDGRVSRDRSTNTRSNRARPRSTGVRRPHHHAGVLRGADADTAGRGEQRQPRWRRLAQFAQAHKHGQSRTASIFRPSSTRLRLGEGGGLSRVEVIAARSRSAPYFSSPMGPQFVEARPRRLRSPRPDRQSRLAAPGGPGRRCVLAMSSQWCRAWLSAKQLLTLAVVAAVIRCSSGRPRATGPRKGARCRGQKSGRCVTPGTQPGKSKAVLTHSSRPSGGVLWP